MHCSTIKFLVCLITNYSYYFYSQETVIKQLPGLPAQFLHLCYYISKFSYCFINKANVQHVNKSLDSDLY